MEKLPRPRVLGGLTVKVQTGCGSMYVHINWHKGVPFEVFATLGKSGGCGMGQNEAVTRGITLGLRCGIPASEYISQLRGIHCLSPVPFPKETAVTSCPDAIASVLAQYCNLSMDEVVELMTKGGNGDHPPEEEESQAMIRIQELIEEREKQGL